MEHSSNKHIRPFDLYQNLISLQTCNHKPRIASRLAAYLPKQSIYELATDE